MKPTNLADAQNNIIEDNNVRYLKSGNTNQKLPLYIRPKIEETFRNCNFRPSKPF